MDDSKAPRHTALFGALYQDEITWSYFARFLRRFPSLNFPDLSGLLGDPASTRKAFPVRIANLARQLGYRGAPDTAAIIRGHTFYPFAQLEITRDAAARLASTMAHEGFYTDAPVSLVIPGNFHLRVCPKCADEDRARVGGAYWHRMHQLPFLRICCRHGCALHETNVTAGHQEPITAEEAIAAGELQIDDWHQQKVLCAAVNTVALRLDCPSCDQVSQQLQVALAGHEINFPRQPRLGVDSLALLLDKAGLPFDGFLDDAMRIDVRPAPARSSMEEELARRVRILAPSAVDRLSQTYPRRISVRAIALELGGALGPGLAAKWSWKVPVRAALTAFAETDRQFFDRMMIKLPAVAARCPTFWECMSALGIRHLLARRSAWIGEAKLQFSLVRAGKPLQEC